MMMMMMMISFRFGVQEHGLVYEQSEFYIRHLVSLMYFIKTFLHLISATTICAFYCTSHLPYMKHT